MYPCSPCSCWYSTSWVSFFRGGRRWSAGKVFFVFYSKSQNILKYLSKKILSYSRKGSEFYLGCFSGWSVRRTARTICWPLPPGQHPGPKVTFRPASTKQARYTIVRKKIGRELHFNGVYGKNMVLTNINFLSDIISRL